MDAGVSISYDRLPMRLSTFYGPKDRWMSFLLPSNWSFKFLEWRTTRLPSLNSTCRLRLFACLANMCCSGLIVTAEIPVAPAIPVPVKVESIDPGREESMKELRKELEVELRGKKYGKEGIGVRWETAEQIQSKQWLCRETSEGKVPDYMTKFAGHVSAGNVPTYMTCKLCHVFRYFALNCLST